MFDDLYNGRRVLVTGHTGFKGSWLTAWLVRLGAKVCGVSLRPLFEPNHFRLLELPVQSEWCDIREAGELRTIFGEFRPEIVFHLASQSSVERADEDPEQTYSTNVMGCVHLLNAVRETPGVRAAVVALPGGGRAGSDPVAASGRCAAEVIAAYSSRNGRAAAIGLCAGEPVGGGDWSGGRLLPDLVRAALQRRSMEPPSPEAAFECRHVLDFTADCLEAGRRLWTGGTFTGEMAGGAENGPAAVSAFTVSDAARIAAEAWPELGPPAGGRMAGSSGGGGTAESSGGGRSGFRLPPVWSAETAVGRAAAWYRVFHREETVNTAADFDAYFDAARETGAGWIR